MSVSADTGDEELRIKLDPSEGTEYLAVSEGDLTVSVDAAVEEYQRGIFAGHVTRDRFVVGLGIAVGDVAALLLAALLSGVLRGASLPVWLLFALAVPAWLALAGTMGNSSSAMIAGRLGAARIVGSAAVLGCGVAIVTSGGGSRLAAFLLLLVFLDLVQRAVWTVFTKRERRKGRLRLRTVLVGTADEPPDFLGLLGSESSDILPVGRVVMRGDAPARDALPALGTFSDLPSLAAERAIDCLLVASSSFDREELTSLRRFARTAGLALRVYTRAPEAMASHLDIFPLGPGVLITVRPAKLNGIQAMLKRGMDVTGALIGLTLGLPLLAGIAVVVRLTSPGPVLFRQNRVTRGGRVFRIVKFRTMVSDVDRIFAEEGIDPTQAFFKPREDLLVTPVGRVLRALSLDELPQLWNVLVGHMSLVGPRPLPEDQVIANPELLEGRHDVRAGLTGWWQVNGRSDVAADEAVRQDLFYIENWSVGLDVRILLRTIDALLRRRGAY